MNGIHDLGGTQGMGPVYTERNESVFRHDWEKRVMGMFLPLAAYGKFNLDEFRHAIERISPTEYLLGSYYEHWIHAFETLLVEKGMVTAEELETGHAAPGSPKYTPAVPPAMVEPALKGGADAARDSTGIVARFQVGDKVRAIKKQPHGHTRLPRYARGRAGVVDSVHGVFVTPDTNASGAGERPQYVYSVKFTSDELWGKLDNATGKSAVYIDMWDDYLEAA